MPNSESPYTESAALLTSPPRPDSTEPTWFLDSDDPAIVEFAERVIADAGARTDRQKAVALFEAVRDDWRYDPYSITDQSERFRASAVLASEANWCVPKSVLLTAACRAAGIPAGVGFSDVRNHLQSEKLQALMGTDLFVYHGYSVIWLDGAWRKASPAFNRELCERFGTKMLEFDGESDALMHPYDVAGNRHMEYVRGHGSYDDLPFGQMITAIRQAYGPAVTAGVDGVVDQAFHG
ncbi:transglutaminase-like domain-containing protein [Gordonia hirsuta]|nr:transglutaminase family protein [Gordonia hirsuta]